MENRGVPWGSLLMHSWCLLLCLFIQTHLALSQTPTCNPTDLSSLQGFLNGLNSTIPEWGLNTSDCCGWTGIHCDGEGRVIQLNLFNMSLRGSISDSLAGLDQLRSLNLSSNYLKGLIPNRLLHLPQLEQLDLSNNCLSGAIPSDSDLPSIHLFNISTNFFNGSHPILAGSANLTSFDISYNLFRNTINTSICNDWSAVQVLRFSMNSFSSDFPVGFGNCSSLVELWLDMNEISGNLPPDLFRLSYLRKLYVQDNRLTGRLSSEISNLSNLLELDISLNSFSGIIPNVFGKFKKLEYFSAQSNIFTGPLPSSLSYLSTLQVLNLRNNSLRDVISLNFSALAQLSSLDLGSNLFYGLIPSDLSHCSQLKTLNLANNSLTGEIPTSFASLVSLSYLSLSKNDLINITSALGILQKCPNLTNLVLTRNFRSGEEIPLDGIEGFQNMEVLVIPNCGLLGSVPPWLVNCTKLKVLDLSWNQLEGEIPSWIGKLDHLFYLDLSNNSITGEIPNSLTQMKSLISSDNSSQGGAGTVQDFPFFIRRNTTGRGLQYRQVSSFPPSLILSSNNLSGSILPGFGSLKMLHVLDLSKNKLSGVIPDNLSNMSSLETLDLSHNNLSGSIPFSLTKLNFLSSFDVSYNNLTGLIPSGGQFSTFSNSQYEGNPGLCNSRSSNCTNSVPIASVGRQRKNKGVIVGMAFGIGLGTALLLAIVYLVVSRTHSRIQEDTTKEEVSANGHIESAGRLVLLFLNKENKEITVGDIVKATNNFDQANIIGCGGFGLVYKAALPSGKKVAIKRLSGDFGQMEREFHAEIQTLSRAQHENLVLLQGYCKIGNDRLLIYSYMENGSLDYWLHEKLEEGSPLDWETRLRIAQGSARGLAYLHQSCEPHILHRDIKSSNILLDENFEAHLADFGLARLVLPYDTHVTTDLVGTLGYIPPEYGQSSVATFKGDVYSFGVVLLELLTGKRPVDMSKPKGSRDLISWVVQMKKENREAEVFDPFIYDKENDTQMIKMLEVACLCLSNSPKLRPFTHQLVLWLDNISLDQQP